MTVRLVGRSVYNVYIHVLLGVLAVCECVSAGTCGASLGEWAAVHTFHG